MPVNSVEPKKYVVRKPKVFKNIVEDLPPLPKNDKKDYLKEIR
jgi:hypothetical protein